MPAPWATWLVKDLAFFFWEKNDRRFTSFVLTFCTNMAGSFPIVLRYARTPSSEPVTGESGR